MDDATLGMQLARAGRFADALPLLERAHDDAPGDVALLHAVTSLLLWAGRPADAAGRYRATAGRKPDDVTVLTGWGRVLLLMGDTAQAAVALGRALARDPRIAAPGGILAMAWDADDPDAARDVLHDLVAAHPDNADLLCQYAQVLRSAEHLDAARAAFERYRALRPHDPVACVELGRLAAGRGDGAQALVHFAEALALDPANAAALAETAQARRGALDAPLLARIQELALVVQDPMDSAVLNDALARHHDRAGEFVQAAAHVARMNAAQEQHIPPQLRYNAQRHAQECDFAIATQDAAFFERLRGAGSPDARPVFVIGLPRSGTTLLERMLAAHPRVVGVGEQPLARMGMQRALAASGGSLQALLPAAVRAASEWHLGMLHDRVRRLAVMRDGDRIVDKLPDNYLLAGWLSIAFPNAAILHCLRDPRDVALSCWMTQFARIQWAFRLEDIAHRIEQHRRLMRHWRATIGPRITEMRYERLVAEPETELRRALEAVGVAWNADVLGFSERGGFVGSASRHQVREGLHARSVGRWRNHADALRPVLPRLEAIAAQDAMDDATR